jgi:hypothetical protein
MNLINVYTAAGQLEAEMVKSFLEAQGIRATLTQESVGRTYGLSAGILGMVQVLVPEDQEIDAKSVLDAMEKGEFENSIPQEYNPSPDEEEV